MPKVCWAPSIATTCVRWVRSPSVRRARTLASLTAFVALASAAAIARDSMGGLTWHDVWPRDAVGAIGAIAIAPSDKNVVWAGTGEPNPRNDASYGDGIWLTRDGGTRWSRRGLSDSYAVSKILVNP